MIKRLLLAAVVMWAAGWSSAAERKPNVVFILADDLGWADVGCYGADLHETPNIDAFAKTGVRFPQAYAMSVCSPTRAAILTGKHAARLHITIWREGSFDKPRPRQKLVQPETEHDLPLTEVTTAKALKEAGYLTLHVGKWHLGDSAHYPEAQGFDLNIGGTQWGAPNTYFWPFSGTKTFGDFRYVPGLGVGKPGDELTERFTDEAIRLIDEAGDRPFFLNLCYHTPHTPIEARPEKVEHFKKKLQPGMRHQNVTYAAMVSELDDGVGRVLKHLEEKKLADHTIVIFTSDNGGYINKEKQGGQNVTDNFPLRSGKGSLYEGGVRVPLIVRWPGVTPAGATCEEPEVCMDFFPTLTKACGANAVTGIDGVDLSPVLKDPTAKLGREALYFHYPHYYATTTPVSAMRKGDWKLLEYFEDRHLELYNLKEDPGEKVNLAQKEGEVSQKLRGELEAWRNEVGAQSPTQQRQAAGDVPEVLGKILLEPGD